MAFEKNTMEKKTYTIGLAVIVSVIAVSFAIIRANPNLFLSRQSISILENNKDVEEGIPDTTSVNSHDYSRSGQKEK